MFTFCCRIPNIVHLLRSNAAPLNFTVSTSNYSCRAKRSPPLRKVESKAKATRPKKTPNLSLSGSVCVSAVGSSSGCWDGSKCVRGRAYCIYVSPAVQEVSTKTTFYMFLFESLCFLSYCTHMIYLYSMLLLTLHMQEMVCLKSMLIHLNPDKIYIHSNVYEMGGSKGYWSKLFAGKKPTWSFQHFYIKIDLLRYFLMFAKILLHETRLICVS